MQALSAIASASRPESRSQVPEPDARHAVDHSKLLPAEGRALDIQQVDFVAGLPNTDRHLAEIEAPQGR